MRTVDAAPREYVCLGSLQVPALCQKIHPDVSDLVFGVRTTAFYFHVAETEGNERLGRVEDLRFGHLVSGVVGHGGGAVRIHDWARVGPLRNQRCRQT